jgi:hypothetical protein
LLRRRSWSEKLGRKLELLIFGTGKLVVAHCTANSHMLGRYQLCRHLFTIDPMHSVGSQMLCLLPKAPLVVIDSNTQSSA